MSKKLTVIIVTVVALALVGSVVWLFASGKLVWNGSNTRPAAVTVVCTSDMVENYNRAMYFAVREEGAEPSIDTKAIQSIKKEITDKTNYRDDPSCQTLLFLIAVHERDYETAKESSEAVKELHSKNIFADSNIRGNTPIFMYEVALNSISAEFESKGDTGASN